MQPNVCGPGQDRCAAIPTSEQFYCQPSRCAALQITIMITILLSADVDCPHNTSLASHHTQHSTLLYFCQTILTLLHLTKIGWLMMASTDWRQCLHVKFLCVQCAQQVSKSCGSRRSYWRQQREVKTGLNQF